MSVRLRLTLWYTALLALVLASFATLAYFALARQLTLQFERTAYLQAVARLGVSSAAPRTATSAPGVTIVDGLYTRVTDFRVTSPTSGLDDDKLHLPKEALDRVLAGQRTSSTVEIGGDEFVIYSTPLVADGQVVGMIQVAADLDSLHASLDQLRLMLAAAVICAVMIAAAVGYWLAARGLRPIFELTRIAREIGRSSNLSIRLSAPPRGGELGLLAVTFNEMLDRVEQSVEVQQRFLADASHELRSPIATLRITAETLSRPGLLKPEQRTAALRVLDREATRMSRLVSDLLALARLDADRDVLSATVELDALVLEVYALESRPSEERGVKLRLAELEQVQVRGDRDRLKQLALNLVDNAIRYSGSGKTVTLGVGRVELDDSSWARLSVSDDGPGIPEEYLPHIFERFYRVEARAGAAQDGTGLGLAICDAIARVHGGKIEVRSAESVGTTFTVKLPASAPSDPGASASEAASASSST